MASRKGGAFLLLVVAVLVVILGALQGLLRGEIASQQNGSQRAQQQTMIRAINAAQSADANWSDPVSFPVDEATGESIVVKADDEKKTLTATWVVNDQVTRTLNRPFDRNQDSKSNSEKQ